MTTRDPLRWAHGADDDFVDVPQMLAWHGAIEALMPDGSSNYLRTNYVVAPMIESIAKFLQRGDPIKPSLAKIIGRLLSGEKFVSFPQGVILPEQFDDDGNVIWNVGPPTRKTLEAFSYRLVDGKVTRVSRGKPYEPFRAGAIWRAAELARADIAAGKARSLAIADAAKAEGVTIAEVRRQLQFDAKRKKVNAGN
jgi:hypothetical protein